MKTVHPRAFSGLLGQGEVASFLTRCIETDQVSHAYLFLGKPGSGKTDCAIAFAKALLCEEGGCSDCDACIRIQRGTHPDVHMLEPAGVSGYMVDQIRELVRDVSLSPVRAKEKVFVIQRADLLQGAAANALLKTLEEPPDKVTFILIGRNREAMLPTILSRCQVVPFKTIPVQKACQLLATQTGFPQEECRYALAAADNSLTQARSFLFSDSDRTLRRDVIDALEGLHLSNDIDLLDQAASIHASVMAQTKEQEAGLKKQRKDLEDFLGTSALKALEKSHKRELSASQRRKFMEVLAITESWLSDCLAVSVGADESLIANADRTPEIVEVATRYDAGNLVDALASVSRARTLLAYNVSSQLVMETLLISLKRGLVDSCPTQ